MKTKKISIRIYPPTNLRIVITAGYIVEPSFGIEIVPAVAEGVLFGDFGQRIGVEQVAPSVIQILADHIAFGVVNSGNVALERFLKVVALPAEHESDRAARLVVEVGAVFVRCLAVFNRLFKIGVDHCAVGGVRGCHRLGRGGVGFLQTHPVHAVDVGHSFAALGRLRELSAVPDKGASAIGQRVADLVIGDRRAVIGRELIFPVGVTKTGCCALTRSKTHRWKFMLMY